MKLDKKYTYISVCPETGEQMSERDVSYSSGICPHCGHNNDSTRAHSRKVVGRWKRPNLWEWLQGKRKEFLRKDEEDAIMDALKGGLENQNTEDCEPTTPNVNINKMKKRRGRNMRRMRPVSKYTFNDQLDDLKKMIDDE